MSNRIILVYHDTIGLNVCDRAVKNISAIAPLKNFEFDKVKVELLSLDNSVFETMKRADAILLCGFDQTKELEAEFVFAIQQKLNLYSTSQYFENFTLVYDGVGGIYHGKKGFDTNKTFGREAYDIVNYGELEIERTARIAYEIADGKERKLLLADRANSLATSGLWRKIVTDINEDYPFVNTKCKYVEHALKDLLYNDVEGVLLTSNAYGSIFDTVCRTKFGFQYTMLAGDTPFATFICTNDTPQSAYRDMLSFSFGIN